LWIDRDSTIVVQALTKCWNDSDTWPKAVRICCRAAVDLVLTFSSTLTLAAADPDALWHIAHDLCVPHQQQNHDPAPCVEVDVPGGYAILKDRVGKTQFLLIATERISGIESPEILDPAAPNYWDAAWRSRHFVEERAGRALPRDAIGLAINSVSGRTQDQLHIHIDCVRPDVRALLSEHMDAVGETWARFPAPLVGHAYMAMRVEQPELGNANPFVLLARRIPTARDDMAHETIVVIGARFGDQDGFVVLAGQASASTEDRASGEELLDHACAVASGTE